MLDNINHFVVLMLENRSFDHLLGSLKTLNPAVAGALSGEYSNPQDPVEPNSPRVFTGPASAFAMPFDPGHEFLDVQMQLYGRAPGGKRGPAPKIEPAPMNGFIYSATDAAHNAANAGRVMQCFQPEQLPVLMSLAPGVRRIQLLALLASRSYLAQSLFRSCGHFGWLGGQPQRPRYHRRIQFPRWHDLRAARGRR